MISNRAPATILLSALRQERLFAVVRRRGTPAAGAGDPESDAGWKRAHALLTLGVGVLELTADTPGALEALPHLRAAFPQALLGIGTVLTPEVAQRAQEAGAQFVVTPVPCPEVQRWCLAHDLPVLAGAMTPGEIVRAWSDGCTAVKLFPAGALGAAYLAAVREPLPDIPIVAVGGVTLENAGALLAAGAVALGVGSALRAADLPEWRRLRA